MRAILIYTGSRLALFLGILGVLALFGFSGYPLVLIALVASAPASYFLLSRQRIEMALVVDRYARRMQQHSAESAAAEDASAQDDAQPAVQQPPQPRRRITAIR